MELKTAKEVAIERITKLPKNEVSKVLIFIAGLDAGMRVDTDKQPVNVKTLN